MIEQDWRRRFRTPEVGGVRWSALRPDRLAVLSSEGGSTGAWAWDLSSGRRRISGSSIVDLWFTQVLATPDGQGVAWWDDALGDEHGRWMVAPFSGGRAAPLLPGIPDGWYSGVSLVPGVVAAGFSTDDAEYVVYVTRGGGPPRVVYRSDRAAGVGAEDPPGVGGLSADGELLCIRHAEAGDIVHPAIRVLNLAEGVGVGDVNDAGRPVLPSAWSPVRGDERLVVIRELGERSRPWIWDLSSGALEEIALDLPGDIARVWWYPDGRRLLLHHEHEARPSLHRLDLASRRTEQVVGPGGTIEDAGVRPDGTVWYRYEDGSTPPRWLAEDGTGVLALPDAATPPGRGWEPLWFGGGGGEKVQGWLLRPPGHGPHPTVLWAHGGPEWHVSDRWDPAHQAYADHGFAVLAVNYRGSTGYGATFRESLHGNLGFAESEDLLAGLDHAVERGIVDSDRVFLEGWSHGGFLATLNAGLHPERWRGVIAGIPVGDLVAAHYESAPALQAWDRVVHGGDPMEVPGVYRERNPMTYVDRVRAPVLIIAGERDSRCPLGQAMVYAHALRSRGQSVEVHLYPQGHHSPHVEERVRQVELILEFMQRCLSGGDLSRGARATTG
jgi:acetyl esterase/lipase